MTFKNFFTVGARRAPMRKQGRRDGRMTGDQFDKFVRQPFREKTFQQATSAGRRGSYDAFDHTAMHRDAASNFRVINMSKLPAVQVKRIATNNGSRPPKQIPSPRGQRRIS